MNTCHGKQVACWVSATMLIFATCLSVRESKKVSNSGFPAVDPGFQLLDSRSFSMKPEFRIPIVSGIPGSYICITDSKAQNSGFHLQKFPGYRNPDSLHGASCSYLLTKVCEHIPPIARITVIAYQIIPKWCIVSSWVILEAIRWDRQPEKPTILVEGVNNTQERQKLVWTYVIEASESIERVTFQRRRDNADPAEDIAISSRGSFFGVFSKFISNYSASLPATLTLRNPVTNDDEFIYSIRVSVSRNDIPWPSLTDEVQLIVFGK